MSGSHVRLDSRRGTTAGSFCARARLTALLGALLAAAACVPAANAAQPRAGSPGSLQGPVPSAVRLGAQPLSFEPNRGQAADGVAYLARGRGYAIALAADGVALTSGAQALKMSIVGGVRGARGEALQRLPATVGYAGAQGSRRGLDNIPTYGAVRYDGVYPGIDVRYYGGAQGFEYDFEVRPGANPARIRLAFKGTDRPLIAAGGDLVLRTPSGTVRQHRPVLYQVVRGQRRPVSGGYAVAGNTVGFRVGAYDRGAPLVIDPVVVYSTYFGSKADDTANGIAVDGQGNVYVAGTTMNGKNKVAFLSKLDHTGRNVLYTKFVSNIYTDTKVACDATGTGVAVDAQGNAYFTGQYGYTDEFNLCTNQAVLWTKVNPGGAMNVKIFGKYGGSKGSAIAIDRQGSTYITGSTDQWEANFPVTQGAFQPKAGISMAEEGVAGDAFVLKVDTSGQVIYGTFLGGSAIDDGLGIAVDAQGQAYVVGTSSSNDFPITANAYQRQKHNAFADAFLTKLSADGAAVLYSTFVSGNNGEDLTGVAVDGRGDAYVVGSSDSSDFPTTPTAYKRTCGSDSICDATKTWWTDYGSNTNYWHINVAEDVVVAVIDTTRGGAAALRYSTFIGGRGRDLGTAIALDTYGRAYITGRTASIGYPGSQATSVSSYSVLLSVVNPRQAGVNSLAFSATFGGNGDDAGQGIALDKQGNVYISGYTASSNFPVRNALQNADAGGYDVFLTKVGGF